MNSYRPSHYYGPPDLDSEAAPDEFQGRQKPFISKKARKNRKNITQTKQPRK